ncbi:MAG: nucleotide-binding universal stress UspA family protein [Sphingobacteriales bacterium]|jgi:nucleotide-binding universal stress UspA family protein
MKRNSLQKILVPIDFSESSLVALKEAVTFANIFNASITLLYVHEAHDLSHTIKSLLFSKGSDQENRKLVAESMEEKFQELISLHQGDSALKFDTEMASGKIYQEITRIAEEGEYGLIVMGTHGIKGIENFVVGSNTFRVVCSATCPTLTVHSETDKNEFKNIILPLDLSSSTREKVDDALYFAHHFGSTIHIAGVTTLKGEEKEHFKLNKIIEQVQKYIEDEGIKTTAYFEAGDNITTLTLEYAKKIKADLIIIMTEQEEHISGFFLGPYAQQMINSSKIPVICIRPQEKEHDFIRPY